ncbi:hypothetical protein BCR32DRAFT_290927 [Anaeromyces robustus]|uniref:Uncharacterized protein n=1 Tax=Anaeromyces robustus TaxID=1754192 RepID=A0A1Y1XH45_9FUNG|nr:hypothetical protein BCR32DRAFT_290927 [Anaeromyces robustus]|eukprot:ORX85067.1 hypothetical protein BCR32DRAFT_290927 [Anaeromyces robustus]
MNNILSFLFGVGTCIILFLVVYGHRLVHKIQKKKNQPLILMPFKMLLQEWIFVLLNAGINDENDQEGSIIEQKPLEANHLQYWEFESESAKENNKYLIKLKGTTLYLTPSSNKINSPIILKELSKDENQYWILIEQHPIV